MSGQLKRFIHWHALDWAFQIVISILLARQHLCFFSWLAHPAKNLYQIHFNLNSTKRVQANHKPLFFYLTDDLHFSHTQKKSRPGISSNITELRALKSPEYWKMICTRFFDGISQVSLCIQISLLPQFLLKKEAVAWMMMTRILRGS